MDPVVAHRFETEFVPRIAQALAGFLDNRARIEVVPYGGPGHPTAVVVRAPAREPLHGYAHPLDLRFTWDPDEIQRLLERSGAERFAHYLDALPRKLAAWEFARDIDFHSRSQAEPRILLGNLDFEG